MTIEELLQSVEKYGRWTTVVPAVSGPLASVLGVVMMSVPSDALRSTLGDPAELVSGNKPVVDESLADLPKFWVVVARNVMSDTVSISAVALAFALASAVVFCFPNWLKRPGKTALGVNLRLGAAAVFIALCMLVYPAFRAPARLSNIAVASAAPSDFVLSGAWAEDQVRREAAELYALFHGIDPERPLSSGNRCCAGKAQLEEIERRFGRLATTALVGFLLLVAVTLFLLSGLRILTRLTVEQRRKVLTAGASLLLGATVLQLVQWWWLFSCYGHLHGASKFLQASLADYTAVGGEHSGHWPFCTPQFESIGENELRIKNIWPLTSEFTIEWEIMGVASAAEGCVPSEPSYKAYKCKLPLVTAKLKHTGSVPGVLTYPMGRKQLRERLSAKGMRFEEDARLVSLVIHSGAFGAPFHVADLVPLGGHPQ